jgi:hypothetical protein
MGLFDGQPLTWDEVQAAEVKRLAAQGATVRTLSVRGPGKTVMRTARHRPWAELLGPGPDGMTCGDCHHLTRVRLSKTYLKCGRQTITRGPGTDIRAKDPACRFFEAKRGGH